MTRARERNLEGYVERHHIVPRCLGGTDDVMNIVRLTPEEHYLAHQLLVKMYPGNLKLASAVTMFGASIPGRKGMKVYGWLRRNLSKAKTGTKTAPLTEEHKAKIGDALRGISWGKLNDEQKRKLSVAKTGLKIKRTAAHNAKIGMANKHFHHSKLIMKSYLIDF